MDAWIGPWQIARGLFLALRLRRHPQCRPESFQRLSNKEARFIAGLFSCRYFTKRKPWLRLAAFSAVSDARSAPPSCGEGYLLYCVAGGF